MVAIDAGSRVPAEDAATMKTVYLVDELVAESVVPGGAGKRLCRALMGAYSEGHRRQNGNCKNTCNLSAHFHPPRKIQQAHTAVFAR